MSFLLNNSELCLFLQKISIVSITPLDHITNFPNPNSTKSDFVRLPSKRSVAAIGLYDHWRSVDETASYTRAYTHHLYCYRSAEQVDTTKIYFHPGFSSSEAVFLRDSFDSWQNNYPVILPFRLIVCNFREKETRVAWVRLLGFQ